jgi:hypothetical protein
MSDRRRTNRFVIPDFTEATFRLMQDVCVERAADQVIVVSDVPLRTGEGMLIELPRELGTRSLTRADVVSCTVVWTGDKRRYRIAMRPERSGEPARETRASSVATLPPPSALPAIGVLIRRVPVRIHDVSTTGCLLESFDALGEGAVGQLEIHFNDITHQEPIRICRSSNVTGTAWPWRSGAHFLSLTAPLTSSVRNIAARFEIIDELASRVRATADHSAQQADPPSTESDGVSLN